MALQIHRIHLLSFQAHLVGWLSCMLFLSGAAYAQTTATPINGCVTLNGQLFCKVDSPDVRNQAALISSTFNNPLTSDPSQSQVPEQSVMITLANAELQAQSESRAATDNVAAVRASAAGAKGQAVMAGAQSDAADKTYQQLSTTFGVLSQQITLLQHRITSAAESEAAQLQAQLAQLVAKAEEARSVRDGLKERVQELKAQAQSASESLAAVGKKIESALKAEFLAKRAAIEASAAKQKVWTDLQNSASRPLSDVVPK